MTVSRQLASFAASLRYNDLPSAVVDRTLQLLLDWLGSALAGTRARPVVAFEKLSRELGPESGPSQILGSRKMTSPLFAALDDSEIRRLHDTVSMVVDREVDALYPQKWSARVEVELDHGTVYRHYLASPKGDPDNPLSRDEIERKFHKLCEFGGAVSVGEMDALMAQCWRLPDVADFKDCLTLPLCGG